MFSKFKAFHRSAPKDHLDPAAEKDGAGIGTGTLEVPQSDPEPLAKKQPSPDTILKIRSEIEQAQPFFVDRAQFGIGMACNAMEDPIDLRGFIDFNQYDVNTDNPSFWKLQTQSGVMFGQFTENGAFVYPVDQNKNAPFENSKLGRGLASFGGQFQPDMAKCKPLMKPVGSVTIEQIEQALIFCTTHKAAVAIALLARHLPDGAQCDFASVRRLRTLENGIKRISLGVRLRNKQGVTKFYRLLLDAEKAVLVEQSDKVIASIPSDVISSAAIDCGLV